MYPSTVAPTRPRLTAAKVAGILFAVAAAGVLAIAIAVSGKDSPASYQPAKPAPEPALSAVESSFVGQLGAIDPGLVVKPSRAVGRGESVCYEQARGRSGAALVEYARQEFDGGNAAVDTAKAQQIVALIGAVGLCAGS